MRDLVALLVVSLFFLFLGVFPAVKAEEEADRITSLPGWEGDLPSRMWSGYVDVGGGARSLHYWLIEAEEEPEKAPLVLWMQGGPGASGMFGLLTEMGPFDLNDASLEGVRQEKGWTELLGSAEEEEAVPPVSLETTRRNRRLTPKLRGERERGEGGTEATEAGEKGFEGGEDRQKWSIEEVKEEEDLETSPKLLARKFSWSKKANMLFFESPAGVGFSRCFDSSGAPSLDACPVYTDESAALDNWEFLLGFFQKFGELKGRPFFITGESYAGIYVPMLAELVMKKPIEGVNLQGVMVGDGCTGKDSEGGCGVDSMHWFVEFMAGHGQVSQKTLGRVRAACGDSLRKRGWDKDENCKKAVTDFRNETGGFYEYHVYDTCFLRPVNSDSTSSEDGDTGTTLEWGGFGFPPPLDIGRAQRDRRGQRSVEGQTSRRRTSSEIGEENSARTVVRGAMNDYPCGGSAALGKWIHREDVKSALHVKGSWVEHDGWPEHYKSTKDDVRPIYKELMKAGVRVLIFFGDADPGVPFNGGEFWTSNAGLTESEGWRAWTVDGERQVGGYVTRYEEGLDFVTIRGAGHMVPQYKPEAAYVMFTTFLQDGALPEYDWNAPTPEPI
uniref:Carboxypeptidase n=1 Tax=Chromera velia CCMP2878 TaxID=1169474 RepID=A0A0G4HAN5_9ALVE|mmetsp:Transcript_33144/g.65812  ORF Transcript_33144/g.65812 Transcript_33144/m.65812 type:complete len:613 (+) Transcript_33144:131-1969(+)|eukprot:Cvel_25594.t1-p1 / transcript=Cvel_25594.t1 / gene=Cvel_25594 / organism=Chromera_velia_CCMP2878 / gene_product=Serine carboxypeptidase 1, putative / transcript_product=Serine carboxypeptidase 1, putative / location=Cvel_scaffold2920:14384-20763(+) / protein_length=612 / sequence_SO=supercontig / SO=protein_coding / is_pseudo=false